MQGIFSGQAYQFLTRLYKEYGRKVRPRAEGFAIPAPGYDPEIHRTIQAAGVAHQHQWTDCVCLRGTGNPLRTAEMTLENAYSMVDGIANNGRHGKELERAQAEARRTTLERKPSIRERLEDAKRECRERNVSVKPAL